MISLRHSETQQIAELHVDCAAGVDEVVARVIQEGSAGTACAIFKARTESRVEVGGVADVAEVESGPGVGGVGDEGVGEEVFGVLVRGIGGVGKG